MTHLNIHNQMSNNNSRPSRRKPAQIEDKPTVDYPPTEEFSASNKYEPKPKIGSPNIGRSPNYVTKVGLGNLKVTTAHGNSDV
jgi:hypothetical protein